MLLAGLQVGIARQLVEWSDEEAHDSYVPRVYRVRNGLDATFSLEPDTHAND